MFKVAVTKYFELLTLFSHNRHRKVLCSLLVAVLLSYICAFTRKFRSFVKINVTRSSAVAKRPRDASCLYSFYTLEWCGYLTVKKIPIYVYSF